MRTMLMLPASLVLATVLPVQAQEIDRHHFVSLAMIVTDHEPCLQAFARWADKPRPVLWVTVPPEVKDFGAEEVYERDGRHGTVAFARESWLFFHGIPHSMVFRQLAVEGVGITGTFRVVGAGEGGEEMEPPVRGTLWYPRFDGQGPARVAFEDPPPPDDGQRKRRGKGR